MYIYIAGPYTKGDTVMHIRTAMEIADELISMGHVPFIPHMTFAWHMVSPRPVEFWYEYDLKWLEKCDAVYRFDGESTGADREVQFAKELDIPVFYSLSELWNFTQDPDKFGEVI